VNRGVGVFAKTGKRATAVKYRAMQVK